MERIIFPKEVPKVGDLVQIFSEEGILICETKVISRSFSEEKFEEKLYAITFYDDDLVLVYVEGKKEWYISLDRDVTEFTYYLSIMLDPRIPPKKAKILVISN